MKVFVIPSWYPSASSPYSGGFFRDQALLYSQHHPEDMLALSQWGPNDSRLLLETSGFLNWPHKIIRSKKIKAESTLLASNCIEYFDPAFTWTRRFAEGNLKNIIAASTRNFRSFSQQYGTPDVIHAHVAFPAGYVANALRQEFDVPTLIKEHMSPFPMPGLQWNLEKYVLAPLKSANKVVAVSSGLAREMKPYGVESTVIPNFIDDSFFVPSTDIQEGREFQFLGVGRLEPQKGFRHLIEAVQILRERGESKFRLKIVGAGSLKGELLQQVYENSLDDYVTLLGSKGKMEIRGLLQRSDAFVFPSNHESFGIAPLEALACGVPIIGTANGEVSQMINNVTGLLVEKQDPDSLAARMMQIMSDREKYDSNQIRLFYEEKYGSKKTVQKLRKVYLEMVSQSR